MLDTRPLLLDTDFPALRRGELGTLQVNLGYLCNQTCTHCHVNAGPKRTELMDRITIDLVLEVLKERSITLLDLTGGAPEMNPDFRYLVAGARAQGVEVMDRCNLTILMEPGYLELHEFLAEHQVRIIASLPCYGPENVAEQRGKGVFEASIAALRKLNKAGYGYDPELTLNLVYNPNGAFLPPAQHTLEAEYKARLNDDFGVVFDNLFTLANMPVSRFGGMLLATNQYQAYMKLLKDNFTAANLHSVMCRTLVSVDWQGYLYDCDFNQMLDMPLRACPDDERSLIARENPRPHLRSLLEDFQIVGQAIAIGEHCYGCTAGQGSSCGGSLSD
ncbi:MAG TPA: radical SAM protein [Porticoccaceae bacterium]|nr:radical SAM protein [Porticoccaceae bacterium]HCO59233.1 radical SAM protein [Porticoccaceae bacterium]